MGQVYELELSHPQQSIALALADHAHDDGSHIFPGIGYIAWKTGYSERNVIRLLNDLENIGLIARVHGRSIGRGNVQEYAMDVCAVPKKEPYKGDSTSPFNRAKHDNLSPNIKGDKLSKGDKSDTEKVTSRTLKGDKSDTAHIKDCARVLTINEPSVEPSVLSPKVAKKGSKFSSETVTQIYAAYPRKVGRDAALKSIASALAKIAREPDPPPDVARWLLERTELFAQSEKGRAGEYTPYPATWFNQGRYADDETNWNPQEMKNDGQLNHNQPQRLSPRNANNEAAAQRFLARKGISIPAE
jgi:hypothetical protein